MPGWKISTKEGRLADPVTAHGETITEGVREVTWSGGSLPDGRLQEFGLSIQTAGGKAGEKAYFKVLQECEQGETAWAEIPVEGEEEPEAPAAEIVFAEAAPASAEPAEQTSGASADGKASTGLAITALVVGALGLVVGAAGPRGRTPREGVVASPSGPRARSQATVRSRPSATGTGGSQPSSRSALPIGARPRAVHEPDRPGVHVRVRAGQGRRRAQPRVPQRPPR